MERLCHIKSNDIQYRSFDIIYHTFALVLWLFSLSFCLHRNAFHQTEIKINGLNACAARTSLQRCRLSIKTASARHHRRIRQILFYILAQTARANTTSSTPCYLFIYLFIIIRNNVLFINALLLFCCGQRQTKMKVNSTRFSHTSRFTCLNWNEQCVISFFLPF